MSSTCDHDFVFMGVVWSIGAERLGSSARDMIYTDRFYCRKCLTYLDENKRVIGNTYSKPQNGTFPA